MPKRTKITVTGNRAPDEYALVAILELNRGAEEIELYGVGDHVCTLADALVELKSRLGDSMEIVSVATGTIKGKGKRKNYMSVVIRVKPS